LRAACYGYVGDRDLPPFPTRRSSDLQDEVGIGDPVQVGQPGVRQRVAQELPADTPQGVALAHHIPQLIGRPAGGRAVWAVAHRRSEEHTSELQSRENLVCRLLLEKKK